MKNSNQKVEFIPYKDDGTTGYIDFDYGAIEDSHVFKGAWGECLKDAVTKYMRRKIFEMFMVFEVLTDEQRAIVIGKEVYGKSFRELGRELNMRHPTIKDHYEKAIYTIRNSPLVKVDFERKRRKD